MCAGVWFPGLMHSDSIGVSDALFCNVKADWTQIP